MAVQALFSSPVEDLADVLRGALTGEAKAVVGGYVQSDFDSHSDDELAQRAFVTLQKHPLTIDRANSTNSVIAAKVPVHDHFDGTVYVDGLRIEVRVKYAGIYDLWDLRPSAFDLSPPRGSIERDELVVSAEVRASEKDSALTEIKKTLDAVEVYIDNQRAQIEAYNSAIIPAVLPMIAARRASLSTAASLSDQLRGI